MKHINAGVLWTFLYRFIKNLYFMGKMKMALNAILSNQPETCRDNAEIDLTVWWEIYIKRTV